MHTKIIDNYLQLYKVSDLLYKSNVLSNKDTQKFNYTINETKRLIQKIIASINYNTSNYGLTKRLTSKSIIVFIALEDVTIKINSKTIVLHKGNVIATHKGNKPQFFIKSTTSFNDSIVNAGVLFYVVGKQIKVMLAKCNIQQLHTQTPINQNCSLQEIECLTYTEAFCNESDIEYNLDTISFKDDTNDYDFYYINLEKDIDRKKVIEKQFNGTLLKRVNAIKHDKGYVGLLLSNYAILSHFIERNTLVNCPVVLEDDCFLVNPLPNFVARWNAYKSYLRAHWGEWNYFSGGSIYITPQRIVCEDPCIVECSSGTCTQFIVHSDASAEKVINHMARKQKVFKGIDRFLNDAFDTFWVPYPFLCIQKSEDTNICNNMCKDDYLSIIQNEFANSQRVLETFVKAHRGKRSSVTAASRERRKSSKQLFQMF